MKGGKVQEIENLLNDLLNKLIGTQISADKDWNQRDLNLNKTIKDTQSQIDQLNVEVKTAQAKLAKYQTLVHRAMKNLKQYKSQLISDQSGVNTLAVRRSKDFAAYKDSLNQHQNLLLALEAVIKALLDLVNSVAALRPTHVKALSEELRDDAWRKKHPAFLEVFSENDITMFIQVAEKADQDALGKLIRMLRDLERSTKRSLADDENSENRSIEIFNKLTQKLNTDIKLLQDIIKKQRTNLRNYKQTVNELHVTINTKQSLVAKNIKFRDQTIAIRLQEYNKYLADTRQRAYERKIIERLRKIVRERLAMSAALKRNVD